MPERSPAGTSSPLPKREGRESESEPTSEPGSPLAAASQIGVGLRTPGFGLVVLAVVLTAITAWFYSFFGRYRPFAELMGDRNAPPGFSLSIDDAFISVRSRGRRVFQATTRSILFSQDRRSVEVDGFHDGVLFNPKGRPAVHIDAGHVDYQVPTGELPTTRFSQVRLYDGVTAFTPTGGGMRMSAAKMQWNAFTGDIRATGPVEVTFRGAGATATIYGLQYNTETHRLFARRTHGTFHVSKLVE